MYYWLFFICVYLGCSIASYIASTISRKYECKNLCNVPSFSSESYKIASRAGTAVFNELSTLKTWRILTSCLTNGA